MKCMGCGAPGQGAGMWLCDRCYQDKHYKYQHLLRSPVAAQSTSPTRTVLENSSLSSQQSLTPVSKGTHAMKCVVCGSENNVPGFLSLCPACERHYYESRRQAMLQPQMGAGTSPSYPHLPVLRGPSSTYYGPVFNAPLVPKPIPAAGMKVEDLIGWRIWRLRNGYLTAFSRDYAWLPGEVEEGTPGDHDGAGIWAFKTRRRAISKLIETSAPHVWGSIRMWGSVVEHSEGFRATKARIVSLDGATDGVSDEAFERLRRRYGVAESEAPGRDF